MDMHTLLYLKRITNKDLLYSTQNSAQCYVAALMGGTRCFATTWTVACQTPLSMGILQARILEWVAIPSSRGCPQPRSLAGSLAQILYCLEPPEKPPLFLGDAENSLTNVHLYSFQPKHIKPQRMALKINLYRFLPIYL